MTPDPDGVLTPHTPLADTHSELPSLPAPEGADNTLAEQVRVIARENEFLSYSSDRDTCRRYAIHAGILHLAADALASPPPPTDGEG